MFLMLWNQSRTGLCGGGTAPQAVKQQLEQARMIVNQFQNNSQDSDK